MSTTSHGPFFSACGGHNSALMSLSNDSVPARPYCERGSRAKYERIFCDGGRHHDNDISAAFRPSTHGSGRLVSRQPTTMPMSSGAGSTPSSTACTSEANAQTHEVPRLRDGALSTPLHAALARSHRPRDTDHHDTSPQSTLQTAPANRPSRHGVRAVTGCPAPT